MPPSTKRGTAKRPTITADSKSPSAPAPSKRSAESSKHSAKPSKRSAESSKPWKRSATTSKRSATTADSRRADAKTAPKPQSIDQYVARLTPEQRDALQKVRRAIRAAAPGAEECISYGLAAFRLDGKVLVGFGASAKHCAFYPMSGRTISAHAPLLKGFVTTKGSIHFAPERPLPASLIATLTRARVAELRK